MDKICKYYFQLFIYKYKMKTVEQLKEVFINGALVSEEMMFDLIDVAGNVLVELSYTELADLINNSSLIRGVQYVITDFETIYDMPDYINDANTAKMGSIDTFASGVVEPIIVIAKSTNELFKTAYSTIYTQDVLEYRFDYTTHVNSAPTKGKITYRKDTNREISMPFDWRTAQFKRYYVASTGDNYSIFDDGNNNFSLYPVFGDHQSNQLSQIVYNKDMMGDNGVSYGNQFDMENNVFFSNNVTGIRFTEMFNNNFFNNISYLEINIAYNCKFDFISNTSFGNEIINSNLSSLSDVRFGDFCNNITLSNCTSTTFGNNVSTVNVQYSLNYSIIGDGCSEIYTYESAYVHDIVLGKKNTNITFMESTYNITLGDYNSNVLIGTSSTWNKIGSYNSNINIGTASSYNEINSYCDAITLGVGNTANIISNYVHTIETFNDFRYNTIDIGVTLGSAVNSMFYTDIKTVTLKGGLGATASPHTYLTWFNGATISSVFLS